MESSNSGSTLYYQISLRPSDLNGGSMAYITYRDASSMANDLRTLLGYTENAIARSPCNPTADHHQTVILDLSPETAAHFGWTPNLELTPGRP